MKEQVFKVIGKVLAIPFVANYLINRALANPYTHIPPNDGSYMKRFWLLTEDGYLSRLIGISIRVHFIFSPDRDRALHTHPFPFRTFILKGGYTEIQPNKSKAYKAGDTYSLDIRTPHAITSVDSGTVSLFVAGRRTDDWFFDTDEGLIPHAKYLNEQGE